MCGNDPGPEEDANQCGYRGSPVDLASFRCRGMDQPDAASSTLVRGSLCQRRSTRRFMMAAGQLRAAPLRLTSTQKSAEGGVSLSAGNGLAGVLNRSQTIFDDVHRDTGLLF